jgi:hypothetical protein
VSCPDRISPTDSIPLRSHVCCDDDCSGDAAGLARSCGATVGDSTAAMLALTAGCSDARGGGGVPITGVTASGDRRTRIGRRCERRPSSTCARSSRSSCPMDTHCCHCSGGTVRLMISSCCCTRSTITHSHEDRSLARHAHIKYTAQSHTVGVATLRKTTNSIAIAPVTHTQAWVRAGRLANGAAVACGGASSGAAHSHEPPAA